jgi:DNA-binding transcriptional MerR regulator
MAKQVPQKLFYKIGEVCELTDTQPYVLRFWESEFPQLAPQKNRSGQRMYRREDIATVERIKSLLYDEGFTIAGARKRLESDEIGEATTAPDAVAEPQTVSAAGGSHPAADLKELLLRELRALRSRMDRTDRQLRGGDDPEIS